MVDFSLESNNFDIRLYKNKREKGEFPNKKLKEKFLCYIGFSCHAIFVVGFILLVLENKGS